MSGIYHYTPETNHVSRVYSVAAVLYLQFVLHVMLIRLRNMLCNFTPALTAVRLQCPIWPLFCTSLISCFPGVLLRYCLSDFKIVPVAPVTTGVLLSHSTRTEFLLRGLYILELSQILS